MLIVVAAALFDARGRILVQQRRSDATHGGLWEFPGGKVEAGETLEDALVRELAEELGIELRRDDLSPVAFGRDESEGRNIVLLLFRAAAWRGEPQAREEQTVAWVEVTALRALRMPPADIPLVAALMRLGERRGE